MPPVPPYISDYVKEFIMTLNLARVHPILFSNNVLEPLRNRVHHTLHYNSCSVGLKPVDEGFTAVDSLIQQLCKDPRQLGGLRWNTRFESIIDPSDVGRIDIFNSSYEQAQIGEQDFVREILFHECDFNYEHLYVFFEYETSCGFEIASNLLIDDGN